MKPILRIYARDIRNIATNWVAAVIILGLVFLPSLYAWFNIEASWDPYSQTGGIAVAVANNDKGTTLRGSPLDLGSKVISSLQENHNIGWTFVDEEEALQGVKHGDYYACIIIPEHFSANIATVLTDSPQKAELFYYVNEKINAISPKITAKGASGIIEEVSQSFVKTANSTIFQAFNEIGIELQLELPTIEQVISVIFRLEAMFPEINQAVDTAVTDIGLANELALKAQKNLPLIAQLAEDGEQFSGQLSGWLNQNSTALEAAVPNMKQDLLILQRKVLAGQQLTGIIQDNRLPRQLAAGAIEQASRRLTTAVAVTGNITALFERLNKLGPAGGVGNAAERLGQLHDRLKQQLELISQLQEAYAKGQTPAEELIAGLDRLTAESADILADLLNRYDSEIAPRMLEAIHTATEAAQTAQRVLADAGKSIPDVKRVLDDAVKGIGIGTQELLAIQKNLPAIEAKITSLADRIRELEKQGSLTDLIHLLRNDYEKKGEFFSEPVLLKETKLYPIPNYGSAMSPFFTTLSLWVGALLLVSLLTVEVHHGQEDVPYKSYQIYFGRYLTFWTLAIGQSVMVTLGDIYVLHTYVVDKLWFVLFGMLLSSVFMLIVYTLVSVFGNVGKAMAIVLLVLQLAGSGGTFPIQVTPPFFQAIHPFLPFTYGISMMREAVGGILWDVVQEDLYMMSAYVGLILLIGLALKKTINRSTANLVKKARSSHLIH